MNAQYKIQYAIQVDELVRMPESTAAIKHKFYEMSGSPNVIGAIDCTHVGINNLPPATKHVCQRKEANY